MSALSYLFHARSPNTPAAEPPLLSYGAAHAHGSPGAGPARETAEGIPGGALSHGP